MSGERVIRPVAVIRNGFRTKFGVPRQSGLDSLTVSSIVMEPEYRAAEAFRGIEEFSHLWLLWLFDGFDGGFSPTVRPPKLGGNRRVGVFASRSPNRPNGVGMSVVRLLGVENDPVSGPVLRVSGADMADGTRIIDIKPYIPYADSVPDAGAGYAVGGDKKRLTVSCRAEIPPSMTEETKKAVFGVLSLDPRPGYHDDPDREYYMEYSGYEIRFSADDAELVITGITEI